MAASLIRRFSTNCHWSSNFFALHSHSQGRGHKELHPRTCQFLHCLTQFNVFYSTEVKPLPSHFEGYKQAANILPPVLGRTPLNIAKSSCLPTHLPNTFELEWPSLQWIFKCKCSQTAYICRTRSYTFMNASVQVSRECKTRCLFLLMIMFLSDGRLKALIKSLLEVKVSTIRYSGRKV